MDFVPIEKRKAEPEEGGGERHVEELKGRTINELYQRLLMTGELARANVNKHQTHGTKEECLRMLKNAKPVPLYMEQSQIDKVEKEILEQTEKIKNIKKGDIYKEQLKQNLEKLKNENEIKFLTKEIEFQQAIRKEKKQNEMV